MSEPTLDLFCACDADALDRVVRWAHTTELVDPSPYLTGGELVCTVGTALADAPSIERFVEAVATVGASGICFGTGDVYDEVPATLLDACRSSGLPLLVAPLGRPFMAISEWVADRRAGAEAAEHLRTEALVGELLAGLRAHQPVETLLEVCTAQIGGTFQLTSSATKGSHEAGTGASSAARRVESARPTPAGQVVVRSAADGVALVWTGPPPSPQPSFLATLVRLLAVARHERDVESDLRRERAGELITLVAERLASPAALEPLLDRAGLSPSRLVFSAWPSGAVRLLADSLSEAPALLGETPTLAFVVTGSDDLALRGAMDLGLPCGYSRPVTLADSSRALTEARAAFDLAQRHGGAVGPEGLTTLEGLLAQQPPERLAPFVDRLVEPLLAADRRRRTHLVPTLRAFLAHDGSLIHTARSQYLHVNTVRHRLQRIHALTGRDPLHASQRTDLMIALWASDHREQPDAGAATVGTPGTPDGRPHRHDRAPVKARTRRE